MGAREEIGAGGGIWEQGGDWSKGTKMGAREMEIGAGGGRWEQGGGRLEQGGEDGRKDWEIGAGGRRLEQGDIQNYILGASLSNMVKSTCNNIINISVI